MKKSTFFAGIFWLVLSFAAAIDASAQNRKSVSAAEVTGTFRSHFKGKFKDFSNEIKILALGKGKLKVSFQLVYPYVMGNGELMANTGEGAGEAAIVGDTAVYSSDEFGNCKITIKFVKPGLIRASQEDPGSECGFGHNVAANGTYKKVSRARPRF